MAVAVVVHLDAAGLPGSRLAELCEGAALLASRLRQQGVAAVVLLHCSSAADAAAMHGAVQAVSGPAPPILVSQPGQLPISLRLALEQLAPFLPGDVVFVSVSDSSSAASQAAALGYGAVERVPAQTATAAQLQAWGLQAAACHAARNTVPLPLMVGYVMKHSRQLALSAQGMLPLLAPPADVLPAAGATAGASAAMPAGGHMSAGHSSSSAGSDRRAVCFMPLDLASSLPHQLRRCLIVLQKLTDFLQPAAGSSGSRGAVAPFTPDAAALLAALEQQQRQQQGSEAGAAAGEATRQPPVCLVDPAASLQPIMDRAQLVAHLEATATAVRQQAIPMRAPASLLLCSYDAAATPRQLAAAGVSLPCIVKPRAACGVAEAHQMAFVLHGSGFADLEVPLPALAQEYVDHGGVVWKVYVAGQQVFWTQRKSSPDLAPLAAQLAADPDADIPASIGFDSLNSLPTTLPWLQRTPQKQRQQQVHDGWQRGQQQADGGQQQGHQQPAAAAAANGSEVSSPIKSAPGQDLMRPATFEAVAAALRQRLGLTLFGFDLVFDSAAGELVIVDVNYFPSFKGIPEAPAALQAALREAHAAHLAAWRAGQ